MNGKLKTILICCGAGIVLLCGAFFFGYIRGGSVSRDSYSKRLHELDAKYASQTVVITSDLAKAEERAGNAEIARANTEKQLERAIKTNGDMAKTVRDVTKSSDAIARSTRDITGIITTIFNSESGTISTGTTIDGIITEIADGLEQLNGDLQRLQGYKQ
jgi:hypothetical protein